VAFAVWAGVTKEEGGNLGDFQGAYGPSYSASQLRFSAEGDAEAVSGHTHPGAKERSKEKQKQATLGLAKAREERTIEFNN
jgi:hypothetical protein